MYFIYHKYLIYEKYYVFMRLKSYYSLILDACMWRSGNESWPHGIVY